MAPAQPKDVVERRWRERLEAVAGARLHHLDAALNHAAEMAALLDSDGRIVACSEAWLAAGHERGLDRQAMDVGADYLAVCDRSAGAGDATAATAAAGIRAVLRAEQRQFSMDYECSGPDERRWFTLRVAQLVGPASGALVTHVDITDVRAAELAVRGELDDLWAIVDPAADFVFLLDEHGHVLGRTRDQTQPHQWPLVGELSLDYLHPGDAAEVLDQFAAVASELGAQCTTRFRARGSALGNWRHYQVSAWNLLDDPLVGGIVVEVFEVTDGLRQRSAGTLAQALAEDLSVSAVTTDEASVITAVNPGGRTLLGIDVPDARGRALRDFIHPASEDRAREIKSSLAAGEVWSGEIDLVRRDGSVVTAFLVARQREDQSGFACRSYIAVDVSRQRDLLISLEQQRLQDPLTDLLNASSFVDHLHRLGATLRPDEQALVAVVALDRFSDVNTLHGTKVGDSVLRSVGSTLRSAIGEGGQVGRLYGDVFAVASAPGAPVEGFGAALQAAIGEIEVTRELSVRVRSSVGLRLMTARDRDGEVVLDEARIALEAAKEAGGHAIVLFDDEIRRTRDARARLRSDLVGALDRGEFAVVFQPVVSLHDGAVVGAEALLRWEHPTDGLISPDVFIPLAEQSAVIHEIGGFVLDRACLQAVHWRDLRPEHPPVVAVNLSASQLSDAGLPDRLERTFAQHGLDPAKIMLELTESMILDPSAISQMARVRATGVRIAIDDFGTGYSSLGRLKELPLDVVKFDRAFISGIGESPENTAIVRSVVSLADVFGIDVVAEGVESEADARSVRTLGCTLGQGYHWSRPVEPGAIDELLRQPFDAVAADDLSGPAATGASSAGDALRTIKHELAAPLAVLRMSIDLRDASGGLPPDVVDTVARNVERAAALIDEFDLLDRLDRGSLRPDRTSVDLEQLIRTVVEGFAAVHGRTFDLDLTPQVLTPADVSLVEVVVSNLIANAVKYSSKQSAVAIRLTVEGDRACVEVHDRGPGIPTERVGTIWRKFGRLNRDIPGAGMGLYLARGIARAHGGDVRYRHGEQGGSVFTLELPREHTGP